MKHPLIGKKIVDKDPQSGQVTRKLILDTFVKVEFVNDSCAWALVASNGGPRYWTIHHDDQMVITNVERN